MTSTNTQTNYSTDFQTFKDRWTKIGVDHMVFPRGTNIELSSIIVPKHAQNKGVGTQFMKELTDLADKHQKLVHLTPATDWGASKTRLHNFYKSHDFVLNKGKYKDFSISSTMLRHPNQYKGDKQLPDIVLPEEKKAPLNSVKDTAISKHLKDDEFKKWFGDQKATNQFGDPVIAYHGSPDVSGIRQSGFRDDKEFFFTNDPKTAKSYHTKFGAYDGKPGTVMTHLKISNPLIHDHKGKEWFGTEDVIRQARKLGHDGVIIHNVIDHYRKNAVKKLQPQKVFVVFNKNQIHILD